jgi:transcription-repair coupling factor (superfamily II helicase)
VPTTLLVQQHTATFAERYAGFPVKVAGLSRFQSDKQAAEVLAGVADGTVDVVIGTHRLLSNDVVFKDLGLVIVDEEQRFGVEHKEHLKALRTNVDVLTMSATPIPRTLEMSITGIREMSTLATPPEERHPVLTYVGQYSDEQVAAAIKRELLREGQVFFVHNRVSSISRVAAQLSGLIPEARIAVAHGQLPEAVLEQVMVDFWERKFDVLVSTTIVESGLDMPAGKDLERLITYQYDVNQRTYDYRIDGVSTVAGFSALTPSLAASVGGGVCSYLSQRPASFSPSTSATASSPCSKRSSSPSMRRFCSAAISTCA